MTNITAEDLINEVLRLAEEHPGAVYEPPAQASPFVTCFYTKGQAGGGTGCIFGQALTNLGAEMVWVVEMEQAGSTKSITHLMVEMDIDCSTDVKSKLSEVQGSQDRGRTWAYAVGPILRVEVAA